MPVAAPVVLWQSAAFDRMQRAGLVRARGNQQPEYPTPIQGRRLRSALFVDFDNVYIGLDQEDQQAARAFADEPSEWLAWMQRLMALPAGITDHEVRRSILLRRCYLSPRRFGRHRPSFTRAGFDVVDCPALTTRGKNSADIRMVIDIIDALNHETHFDEFIILSSDSDFTPVLSRLRAHDRRTTILTVGNISGAYRGACDLMIGSEDFIEFGLGRIMLPYHAEAARAQASRSGAGEGTSAPSTVEVHEASGTAHWSGNGGPGVTPPEGAVDQDLLARIAGSLYVEASINGEIRPEQLAAVYIRFPEFTQDSNWLGYYGLRPMTDAIVATRDDLCVVPGDPWTVAVLKPGARRKEGPAAEPEEEGTDLRRLVADAVVAMVTAAKGPVTLARAAQAITADFGEQIAQSRWAGAGTFKDLLQSISSLPLAFSTVPPGYVYDPERHVPPRATIASGLEQRYPTLAPFVRRVFQITGVPKLTPEQYGLVFAMTAAEVNESGYSLSQTSKAVRDRCAEAGEAVPRQAIIFVLKGLSYRGYDFETEDQHSPRILGAMFRDNVIDLCENAGVEMTEAQLELLDLWLIGEPEGGVVLHAEAHEALPGNGRRGRSARGAGDLGGPDAGSGDLGSGDSEDEDAALDAFGGADRDDDDLADDDLPDEPPDEE